MPDTLPHAERVEKSAKVALREFHRLKAKVGFVAEGRSAFTDVLGRFEAEGGVLSEIMCFVWYLCEK